MKFETSQIEIGSSKSNLIVTIATGSENKTKLVQKDNKDYLEVVISEELKDSDVRNVGNIIGEALEAYDSFTIESELSDEDITKILEDTILKLTPVNYYSSEYKMVTKNITNEEYKEQLAQATTNAYAYNVARMLNHLPHQVVDPEFMATEVTKLFSELENVKVTVLREKQLKEQGYNGHLAVSKGSEVEPALIKIEYNSDNSKKKIGLVGKGMTFDMGGYNIKTQRDLRGMKKDMAGANGVVGAMLKMILNKQKANVTAYLCCSDNLINEKATLPGDVVKYKNGLTVEIINTDAEGRMVLADGLIMAEEDKNEIIIDICTLTGAIVAAIGDLGAGVFSEDKSLTEQTEEISKVIGERTIAMPYLGEYKEKLKSDLADICHMNVEGKAGSFLAALYLDYFVQDAKHLHIDMAAMSEKEYLGNTVNGYGTRLLSALVNEL